MQIGPYTLKNAVALAPMAGVTDLPLRELSVSLGAGLAVAEMLTSDLSLTASRKSSLRRKRSDREGLRSVQIVGHDPRQMAEAARFNADEGAQIIDINMGCPAKKVCRKAAGSALLADPQLVADILDAVVTSVDVPVTLKIRTGTHRGARNGVAIAKIAESAGVQMLVVHGRTRADRFQGTAEYDTIAAIVSAIDIPVLANGDIDSAAKAQQVLAYTGAAGVMVGRAAQGRPWLPGLIARQLSGESTARPPSEEAQIALLRRHVTRLYEFYGPVSGVRFARKHTGWTLDHLYPSDGAAKPMKSVFNGLETADQQLHWLDQLADSTAVAATEAAA